MDEWLFKNRSFVDLEVVRERDNYLFSKNKRYLDFLMGWCVGNAGWNKKQILKSIRNFKGPNYVLPDYRYQKWEELAKKLVETMPNKNYTCFKATGGTESVEIALKISRAYNRKEKFIAFKNAYHGQSFGCMGLVGLHEDKFGPFSDWYVRLETKNWEETTKLAVDAIKKGDVCAFISEPIICNLGVVVPPESFFREVKKACEETNTIFIMDEVATGFGRTGEMFGFEHYNIEPDIVTIAKGFSSGYGVIGSTIVKKEIAESMRFEFSNYSTFGWHPLNVHAALANMQYIEKNKLIEKSVGQSKYLFEKLSEFCKPEGKGLCIGIDTKGIGIGMKCLKDGLLVYDFGNRIVLFPALDVSRKEIDHAAGILKRYV